MQDAAAELQCSSFPDAGRQVANCDQLSCGQSACEKGGQSEPVMAFGAQRDAERVAGAHSTCSSGPEKRLTPAIPNELYSGLSEHKGGQLAASLSEPPAFDDFEAMIRWSRARRAALGIPGD